MNKKNRYVFLVLLIAVLPLLSDTSYLKPPPQLHKQTKHHFREVPFNHSIIEDANVKRAPNDLHPYIVPPSEDLLFLHKKPIYPLNGPTK